MEFNWKLNVRQCRLIIAMGVCNWIGGAIKILSPGESRELYVTMFRYSSDSFFDKGGERQRSITEAILSRLFVDGSDTTDLLFRPGWHRYHWLASPAEHRSPRPRHRIDRVKYWVARHFGSLTAVDLRHVLNKRILLTRKRTTIWSKLVTKHRVVQPSTVAWTTDRKLVYLVFVR